jgi:hypothetical protein
MPITSVTIQNFKGIKGPLRVELKPITLLFGPNSSGKSTVVQALHYAREIFERENVNADRTVLGLDLGGFENLVHRHDKSLPIILRFDLDLRGENLPDCIDDPWEMIGGSDDYYSAGTFEGIPNKVRTAWVEIHVQWSEILNRPLLKRYSVGANGEDLAEITASDDGQEIYITKLVPYNSVFLEEATVEDAKRNGLKILKGEDEITEEEEQEWGEGFIDLMRIMDIVDGLPGLSKPILLAHHSVMPRWGRIIFMEHIENSDFDDSFFIEFSNIIAGTGELVLNALKKLCYLGPLRIVPPRNFQPAKTPDEALWANGTTAWDILFRSDNKFIDTINQWLSGKDCLDSGFKIMIKEFKELDINDPDIISMMQEVQLGGGTNIPDYLKSIPTQRRLVIWEERSKIEVQPLDIGVGVSQLLPVIVAAIFAKRGFVIIEQPELHAHPALQTALGDLFISQVKENPDVIFILETHSEHLLLRLLRRIRETSGEELPPGISALTSEMLSIYFAECDQEGIILTSIGVDKDGEFVDRWPHGFFTERIKELY